MALDRATPRVEELARMLARRPRDRDHAPPGARAARAPRGASPAMIVPSLAEFRALAKERQAGPDLPRGVRGSRTRRSRRSARSTTARTRSCSRASRAARSGGATRSSAAARRMVFIARGDRCETPRGRQGHAARAPSARGAGRPARSEHQAIALPGLPRFCGGAVGYFGYDAVRWFERAAGAARRTISGCRTRCSCSATW